MKFATMVFVALAGVCLSGQAVFAEALEQPSGPVILTITGEVAEKNVDDTVQLDLAEILAIDPVTIETSTIWTEGKQVFTGVLLKSLMERIGAKGTVIAASALNDYTVEIPMTDAVEGGPILAYEANGTPLSVRDKGPLWVVYPYDSGAAYQSEVIYARSIWQVSRLEIKP